MCNDTTDGGTYYPCAPTADVVTYRGATDVCARPGNPLFDYMTAESPYLVVDGEMQWHAGRFDANDRFSGLAASERLRLHHYTSLSMRHGFAPLSNPTENSSAAPGNINFWMNTPLNTSLLRRLGLPISQAYAAAAHSEFDYVRDHLGYRLELQSLTVAVVEQRGNSTRQALELEGTIINRGFSAPVNPRQMHIVLLLPPNASNPNITIAQREPMAHVDVRSWQPFEPGDPRYTPLLHKLSATLVAERAEWLRDGSVELGLQLPDLDPRLAGDSRYAIRLASAGIVWEESLGVNMLGNLSSLLGV